MWGSGGGGGGGGGEGGGVTGCLFFTLFREHFSVHTPARLSDGNAFTAFYSWAFKGSMIPGLH